VSDVVADRSAGGNRGGGNAGIGMPRGSAGTGGEGGTLFGKDVSDGLT
jgi:hypothetical protein